MKGSVAQKYRFLHFVIILRTIPHESWSSSVRPQFLCPFSTWWHHFSLLLYPPFLLAASATNKDLRSSARAPFPEIIPQEWSVIPIGWELNLVGCELLSQASVLVFLCPFSLVSLSSSARPQFLISYSMHWCAILIGWKLNLWECELLCQFHVPVFILHPLVPPFSLVESSTYESVSCSARPSSLFLTPCTGAPFSLVENSTYTMRAWAPQPGPWACVYTPSTCAAMHSHWLKLNLWERELLS